MRSLKMSSLKLDVLSRLGYEQVANLPVLEGIDQLWRIDPWDGAA